MADEADFLMMIEALSHEFLEECQEKLDRIEGCLDDIHSGTGIVDENQMLIKRDIHSIKGGGGSFGFPTISKLCQGLENYLETTSDNQNINVFDIAIFVDAIRSIVFDRKEPDAQDQEMLLKSLPSGRQQSGKMAITRGVGLLIMPKGIQRKIVGQELAQLGFKLTLETNPIAAIDTALVLKPDFVIVSMVNEMLTGPEIANMFHAATVLRHMPFAILTAGNINDLDDAPESTTFIHKGMTFTKDLLMFVNAASDNKHAA